MQNIRYQGVEFYTAKDLLRRSKVRFSKKIFDYLRDTLHLLPRPLKIADKHGRGTVGYYTANLVSFLKKVETEHKKGKSYPQLALQLSREAEALRVQTDRLRLAYENEKKASRLLSSSLKVAIHPEGKAKQTTTPVSMGVPIEEIRTGEYAKAEIVDSPEGIKREIAQLFGRWDGENSESLRAIKEKIEKLEQLEKGAKQVRKPKAS